MQIQSKLPSVGTTIFTVMSALAKEHNAINLSQGYPDFDCDDELKDLVYKYMRDGANQYAPMQGVKELREAIAGKVWSLYGLNIDPMAEVNITSGAAEAIYSAVTTVVRPGDEVIVIDPAYDLYKPAINLSGGTPIVYALKGPDFKIDWDAFSQLVTERTRLIMINTPHNPIGRILTDTDMSSLTDIVVKNDLLVISDEVYEHLVFDGEDHASVLRYPDLYDRSFVAFSFGKTYHVTGWRVGYCIAPPYLMSEFRKVHQFNVFTVITPVQHAFAYYMKEPSHYLSLPKFFQEKRDFLSKGLAGSKFEAIESQGSYFQLYDYSAISDQRDVDFAKKLTIEYGVAAIPVSVFYSNPDPGERLIRLCFGKSTEALEVAAQRLAAI